MWLSKSESVFSSLVLVTDDRVRVVVAAASPVRADLAATEAAVSPVWAPTPAWPDADALLDLDGVSVG